MPSAFIHGFHRVRSQRRVAPAVHGALVLATLVSGAAELWHPDAVVLAADVAIETTVVGPQLGQGGLFIVTTTGTISSSGEGIVASPANGITQLFVEGVVGAQTRGFNNNAGSSVLTASVNGSVAGGSHGVLNSGSIGTLSITFGQVSSSGGTGVENAGTMNYLGIDTPGRISGGGNNGVTNGAGASMTYLINSGSIGGLNGIFSGGAITQLVNHSPGRISGSDNGIAVGVAGAITTIDNAGRTTGFNGVSSRGSIGTLTNYAIGTIQGSYIGARVYDTGTVTAFDNAGTVAGSGEFGMLADPGSSIGTLTNSGTFTGLNGIVSSAVTGTIRNLAGGLIQGSGGRGLGQYGTLTLLENAGSITGGNAIVTGANIGTIENQAGGSIAGSTWGIYHESGTLGALTNMASGTISGGAYGIGIVGTSGTIANAGTVQGSSDSLYVGPSGMVGLLSNTGTATGRIRSEGTITAVENAGSVAGGNAIENYGTITSLTNSGTLNGTGTWGIYTHTNSTLGTLTNTATGTISGGAYTIGILGTSGTITNAGHLQGGSSDMLYVGPAGTVGLFSNTGTVSGPARAIRVEGGTITSVENSGSVAVGTNAIENYGTITSLTNSGGLSGAGQWGIYSHTNGSIGTLTNTATGTISGGQHGIGLAAATGTIANAGLVQGTTGYGVSMISGDLTQLTNTGVVTGGQRAVHSDAGATIGTITNSGTMQGGDYGLVLAATGTITNTATGVIRSTGGAGQSAMYLYSTTDLLSNAGLIDGKTFGIWQAGGSTTALTNSGTITGSTRGVSQNGTIATLTNTATGLIDSPNGDGVFTGSFNPMDVVNAGRITGGRSGVYAWYGIDNLTNQSGGIISGTTGAGVYIENESGTVTNQAGGVISSASDAGVFVGNNSFYGRLETLSNAGSIEGATAGVQVTNGAIRKLTNTGTVAFTGAGGGPAVLVGPGGVLGDSTGARGAAIESTGAGALLDGIIVNQGTIHHGFTIANQSVTVSADGGVGTFTSGLLDVVDGDLTFTGGGTTSLTAGVRVNGGLGTVFNEAVLAVIGSGSIAGNFTQTSAGTMSSIITDPSTFGSLSISGAAAFAGVLDLDLTASFALAEGQSFNLFSFGSYTGDFSGLSVDGVALTSYGANQWLYGRLVLEENWNANAMSVSIAAVPEPSTFALGAAGIACAAWLRHRRRAVARKAA